MSHPTSHLSAYPHLAARLFNVALLVHPQKLDAIIAGLGQRLLGAHIVHSAADSAILPPELFTTRRGPRAERGYQVVDGVAVLNVSGALVHKTRLDADSSTLLGYNSIAADLQDAMDQPDVHAVLQVWDSPGGEAQGAFQYADTALALRGKKPFYAIADGMAASAGYLGASAAERLYITASGYAGSIGVVMRHVDLSAALMSEGVRVSHIYAGAKKIDGNSFEPLSAAVRADFQAEIDSLYSEFIGTVARARGLSADALRATQAATYRGQAAIATGLVDRLGTVDALITELAATRTRAYAPGQTARLTTAAPGAHMHHPSTLEGGHPAATLQPQAQGPAPEPTPTMKTYTQAELDSAIASATATASATAATSATAAERSRISAIQAHANASAQAGLVKLAIDTGMTAEQAAAVLSSAAPAAGATQASAPNAFAATMAGLGNPAVSGIEARSTPDSTDITEQATAMANNILSAYRARV